MEKTQRLGKNDDKKSEKAKQNSKVDKSKGVLVDQLLIKQ